MLGIRALADWAYTSLANRIYECGLALQGYNSAGLSLGPHVSETDEEDAGILEMLKDKVGVVLENVGVELMPRARRLALTPVRLPEYFRLRRQE